MTTHHLLFSYRLYKQILKVNHPEHVVEAPPVTVALEGVLVFGVAVVKVFLLVVVPVSLLVRWILICSVFLHPGVAEGRVKVMRRILKGISVLVDVIAKDELVAGKTQHTDGVAVTQRQVLLYEGHWQQHRLLGV